MPRQRKDLSYWKQFFRSLNPKKELIVNDLTRYWEYHQMHFYRNNWQGKVYEINQSKVI